MFEGKNDNLLYFILLKLPSFMTVLLKVQGAPAALQVENDAAAQVFTVRRNLFCAIFGDFN